MRRLAALLFFVGTARALDETCSTLWSKITHLNCRPHDDLLRDQLDTLALADGGLVSMRCTDDHAFCFRADLGDTETSPFAAARSPSFLTLGRRSDGARSTTTPAAAAARERSNGATGTAPRSFMTPAEVASSATPPVRRSLLSNSTSVPTLAPTPAPTPTPSVSAVPTTTDITTWSQLKNAVADPSISTIFVGVDIAFSAPIEVTRNVTIVGVGGPDTALRDAGTPLDRLFLVNGGALRIESLHLLVNVSALPYASCDASTVSPAEKARARLSLSQRVRRRP